MSVTILSHGAEISTLPAAPLRYRESESQSDDEGMTDENNIGHNP